ncbi:MAG: PKD domain-containing protein [bacterium]|nr:PKD domain-containing protein [bacterium]
MKKIFVMCVVVALLAMMSSTPLFSKVKVGEEVVERFETEHPYEGKKGVVWEQEFHYPEAGYIAVHFTGFDLAKKDYVEISSPDGRFVYKYKAKGKKVKRDTETISSFWATHIPGDTAIVRLYSKNKKSGNGFVIDKWVRGYERGYIEALMTGMEEEELAGIEAICSSDDKEWAKCYEGTEMYNKGKAVCRLLIGGSSACTGWLLGSEGHVMTNNHCIENQTDASNTDFEFMAEGATCATNCASWGACPGVVEADSGTLIQTDSALDYSLVLLPTNVTGTYGYMQFRDTLPSVGERIYIPQHPSAYGKMFAVTSDTDGPYAQVYSLNEPACSGGPGDIGYYADTEGGSSGSPVLGYDDNLVVALHHCANCPNRGVPIPSIIADLGGNIPANAIGSTGPPQPPVADFTSDVTTVQVGNSVNFTDLSTQSPTSWSWAFQGGTPSSSTAQNPTVTYNTIGTYSVTLTATNAVGNDTISKTDYITVQEVVLVYCDSQGNNYNYEYIGNVTVADLDNTSGGSNYTDFTSLTANLTAGASANVSLTPVFPSTTYTEYWKIWIDYNIDGDFEDAGEEVFSDVSTTTVTGSFTVPAGAEGITRMRVSMKWNAAPTPCEAFSYGEVEDYTVNISGGTPPDPPVADFSGTPTTIDEGQSVSFTDLSTNNPTSWSWNFPGGTPSSSTTQNPTVTYNTAGTYSVTLTATNAGGSDGETKTGYITVNEPTTGLVFESGTVSGVGSSWQTVFLGNTYTSPVVVCTTGISGSSDLPVVVRVRNAAGNSFDVMVQNPSGTALSGHMVHYVVVEEGVYTSAVDGVTMEAVKADSAVTAYKNGWTLEPRSYQNTYSNPVVVGQVMTYNDAGWSVFWACGASRTAPPSASAFNAGKEVAEDTDKTRANETIGYIVIEQGSGTINGIPYTAALGADTVRGPGNTSTGYTYNFTSVGTASAAIISAAAIDGNNGGWPVLYGSNPFTASSITTVCDEDQIADSERKHTTEQVAYIVFGQ